MLQLNPTKRCTKCLQIKSSDEFPKRRDKPCGIAAYCKPCNAIRVKHWRNLPGNAEKRSAYHKTYSSTEHGKEANRRGRRIYYYKNKEKCRARDAVKSAIESGKIQRPAKCSNCGIHCKPESHHQNGYAWEHRFDIVWLCKRCHVEADSRQKLHEAVPGQVNTATLY